MKYVDKRKTENVMQIYGCGTVGQRMRYKRKKEAYAEMPKMNKQDEDSCQESSCLSYDRRNCEKD